MTKRYDKTYFDTWYRQRGIGDTARLARKVALAVATAEYHLERPLRTVLDIGCGEGVWRAPLLKLRPKARYLGFDSSEYAVRRFGARRNLHLASFADFALLRPCPPQLRSERPRLRRHRHRRRSYLPTRHSKKALRCR